jgi:O-acetyl-ADP-ribose deacetylase
MKARVNDVTIELIQGNPLEQPVAGLVLATDTNLTLTPLLASLGGPEFQQACAEVGYCEVGASTITISGALPFEKVIHLVGPRWGEGSERGKLANAVHDALQLAEQYQLASLVFPPISTGAQGYPLENCAKTMLSQIIDYTFEDLESLKTVIICLDDKHAYEIFKREFEEQLAEIQDAEV